MLRFCALATVSTLHASIAAGSVGVSYSTPVWVGRNLSRSFGVVWAATKAGASPMSHAAAIEVRRDRIGVSFLAGTDAPACDRPPLRGGRARPRTGSDRPWPAR